MIYLLLFWLEVLCSKLTVFQYQSLVGTGGQNPEQIRFRLDAFGFWQYRALTRKSDALGWRRSAFDEVSAIMTLGK